jgi:hypothetical protein
LINPIGKRDGKGVGDKTIDWAKGWFASISMGTPTQAMSGYQVAFLGPAASYSHQVRANDWYSEHDFPSKWMLANGRELL